MPRSTAPAPIATLPAALDVLPTPMATLPIEDAVLVEPIATPLVPDAVAIVTTPPVAFVLSASAVATPVPRPVTLPIAGVIVTLPAAVSNPLPLTVNVGPAVALPKLPTLELTVASVVASAPAVVVMSPVSAGNCAAWSVPVKPVVGSPVQFVSVPDAGVPSVGVVRTSAGLTARVPDVSMREAPIGVAVGTAVDPVVFISSVFAAIVASDKVPDVVIGLDGDAASPVPAVIDETPELPAALSVPLLIDRLVPVKLVIVCEPTTSDPVALIVAEESDVSPAIVVAAAPSAMPVVPTVTDELTKPPFGKPVQFVSVPDAGVPSAGVVNVGDVSVTPPNVDTVEPSAMFVLPIVNDEFVRSALVTSPVAVNVPVTVRLDSDSVGLTPTVPLVSTIVLLNGVAVGTAVEPVAFIKNELAAIVAKLIVPLVVTGPPVKPAPVATLVTVPPEPPALSVPDESVTPAPIAMVLACPAVASLPSSAPVDTGSALVRFASVARVPVVGSVSVVPAVTLSVVAKAPENVTLPPRDTALPPMEPTVVVPVLLIETSPDIATIEAVPPALPTMMSALATAGNCVSASVPDRFENAGCVDDGTPVVEIALIHWFVTAT